MNKEVFKTAKVFNNECEGLRLKLNLMKSMTYKNVLKVI